MRKHNEERSFAKGKIKTAYKIRAKVNKNYGETDLLKYWKKIKLKMEATKPKVIL